MSKIFDEHLWIEVIASQVSDLCSDTFLYQSSSLEC